MKTRTRLERLERKRQRPEIQVTVDWNNPPTVPPVGTIIIEWPEDEDRKKEPETEDSLS